MKQILLVLICLATACSKEYTDEQTRPISDRTSRSGGDGKYDVLGWGYDITGDYLNPTSVRARVLDLERYEKEFANRIIMHTNSWGSDFFCYGATAEDYLKEVTKKSNCGASVGDTTKVSGFSGTFSSNKEFTDSFSYSSKYSFASLECIRNRRILYLNDDLARISQYLSPEFVEDLKRYSAQQLIEIYGTHVLTDITLGGRYRLIYRSCAMKSTSKTTRRKAVAAGFGALLDKIGIRFNAGGETITNETLAKENLSQELYVCFYGGMGSNLKYSLDSNTPTTIDIQSWDNQISLTGTSVLTDIKWPKAYPISDFISDPIKKAAVKTAIKNYITSKQIKSTKLIPIYDMWYAAAKDTYYTFTWDTVLSEQSRGREYRGLRGYLLAEPNENTLPLYSMWYGKSSDSYYLSSWDAVEYEKTQGREYKGIVGYIIDTNKLALNYNMSPIYYMWYQKNTDSFFCFSLEDANQQVREGRQNQGLFGYCYRPN